MLNSCAIDSIIPVYRTCPLRSVCLGMHKKYMYLSRYLPPLHSTSCVGECGGCPGELNLIIPRTLGWSGTFECPPNGLTRLVGVLVERPQWAPNLSQDHSVRWDTGRLPHGCDRHPTEFASAATSLSLAGTWSGGGHGGESGPRRHTGEQVQDCGSSG